MKLLNLTFFVLFIGVFFPKAQDRNFPMLSVGYAYQNQSFGELGAKMHFNKKEKDNLAFRLGASALMGATQGKFAIMPKIQGDILFNPRKDEEVYLSHAFYYIGGVEATTKYFAPYIGMNILGVLDFTGGYAFSFPNQTLFGKELKGLRLGVVLNIPLDAF